MENPRRIEDGESYCAQTRLRNPGVRESIRRNPYQIQTFHYLWPIERFKRVLFQMLSGSPAKAVVL